MPAKAKMAPAERSKPPAMITRVIPQAMIPIGADWSRMLSRLVFDRNADDAKVSTRNSATKIAMMP